MISTDSLVLDSNLVISVSTYRYRLIVDEVEVNEVEDPLELVVRTVLVVQGELF